MKIPIKLNFETYSSSIGVDEAILNTWTQLTYQQCGIESAEVDVNVVNRHDGEYYNSVFRKKQGPTNVLSFPDGVSGGEIIMCDPVIIDEAKIHELSITARYFQVYVHGLLHLIGYTHDHDADTREMEAIEDKLFDQFDINRT